MLCRGNPFMDGVCEFLRSHTRVGCSHDLQNGRFAAGERRFEIAPEERGEKLLVFPFGVLRRQRLHAVERESKLEVYRLLTPQCSIIVEGGNAFGFRHEIRRPLRRHPLDEVKDGLLGLAFIPGWKLIGTLRRWSCYQKQ